MDQRKLDHHNKYEELCKKFGVVWYKDTPNKFLNVTLEELKDLYEQDPYLNNISLDKWDALAYSLLLFSGSGLSLAEAVCMQKHAARKLLHETYNIGE